MLLFARVSTALCVLSLFVVCKMTDFIPRVVLINFTLFFIGTEGTLLLLLFAWLDYLLQYGFEGFYETGDFDSISCLVLNASLLAMKVKLYIFFFYD